MAEKRGSWFLNSNYYDESTDDENFGVERLSILAKAYNRLLYKLENDKKISANKNMSNKCAQCNKLNRNIKDDLITSENLYRRRSYTYFNSTSSDESTDENVDNLEIDKNISSTNKNKLKKCVQCNKFNCTIKDALITIEDLYPPRNYTNLSDDDEIEIKNVDNFNKNENVTDNKMRPTTISQNIFYAKNRQTAENAKTTQTTNSDIESKLKPIDCVDLVTTLKLKNNLTKKISYRKANNESKTDNSNGNLCDGSISEEKLAEKRDEQEGDDLAEYEEYVEYIAVNEEEYKEVVDVEEYSKIDVENETKKKNEKNLFEKNYCLKSKCSSASNSDSKVSSLCEKETNNINNQKYDKLSSKSNNLIKKLTKKQKFEMFRKEAIELRDACRLDDDSEKQLIIIESINAYKEFLKLVEQQNAVHHQAPRLTIECKDSLLENSDEALSADKNIRTPKAADLKKRACTEINDEPKSKLKKMDLLSTSDETKKSSKAYDAKQIPLDLSKKPEIQQPEEMDEYSEMFKNDILENEVQYSEANSYNEIVRRPLINRLFRKPSTVRDAKQMPLDLSIKAKVEEEKLEDFYETLKNIMFEIQVQILKIQKCYTTKQQIEHEIEELEDKLLIEHIEID